MHLLKVAFLCLMALISACASAPPEHTPDFLKADTNRDGTVSLPEWLSFGGNEASYMAIDKDRTGKLSEAQFREALRMSDQAGGTSQRQQSNIDEALTKQIKAALASSPDLNAGQIRVETYQRNVQLSGTARTSKEKQIAEDIARSVSGVNNAFNQIVIRQ